MKLRYLLPAAAMSAGLIAAVAAPASGADYPTSSRNGSVSASVVGPGGAVTFCGPGFRPGTPVAISVDGSGLRSVSSDSSGRFCTGVRLYSVGRHVLQGRGAAQTVAQSSLRQDGLAGSLQIRNAVMDTSTGTALRVQTAGLATSNGAALQIQPAAVSNGILTVTAVVTVVGSTAVNGAGNTNAGTTGGLPFTGAGIALMVALAAGLAGIGTGIRFMGRRRRQPVT